MRKLTEAEALEFKDAIKKKSSSNKLLARDFTRLKKPIYQDYLKHVKQFAKPEPIRNEDNHPQISISLPKRLQKSELSYYYCEKNELMSLKQFVLLMQQSQKRNLRQQKAARRIQQKQLTQAVERHLQSQNQIRLRLTTSYAKKIVQNHRNSIF